MTRPEFLPIARKSLAIITDEGGLTSHAAIVYRELGIPCIIGTKIATKILKDGDQVEVDANKGIIKLFRKIRKYEEKYKLVRSNAKGRFIIDQIHCDKTFAV